MEMISLVSDENIKKASFEYPLALFLRVSCYCIYLYLIWNYRYEPMFFLPKPWIGPFFHFLPLPFAPMGNHYFALSLKKKKISFLFQ
jgi:hypothetical protein